MSKKPKKVHSHPIITTPPTSSGGGCSFCLFNLSLLLAAPVALVALAVKGARR